jgi:type IV secretion system protein VirB9
VGYQTDIEFDHGEAFVGLAAGDIEGISFVAEANHLFLKPKAPTIGTNLTILTSRHTYQFEYSASLRTPDATEDVVYALRFVYPAESRSVAEAATAEALSVDHPRNVDYWFCGDPSLQPIEASDDGLRTRLRFAASAEQPAIFVLNDDGTESLLNFSIVGEEVVIHRIAPRLILRRGKLIGCVLNKGFPGDGVRPGGHTVSESVVRTTKGSRP